MRFFKTIIAIIGLAVISGIAVVIESDSGQDNQLPYRVIAGSAPLGPGKIEVVEFFWYSCPHCYEFEPIFSQWIKKHEAEIVVRRVPVGFRPLQFPQQKLLYTLQVMAPNMATHQQIFDIIHLGKSPMDNEALLTDYAASIGIDRAKFRQTYNSPEVAQRALAATELHKMYGVVNVPTIVIGGHYVTSPALVAVTMPLWKQTTDNRHAVTLQVMDDLLNKSRQPAPL
jgi:thiol:disulfide interchange protein DsbA